MTVVNILRMNCSKLLTIVQTTNTNYAETDIQDITESILELVHLAATDLPPNVEQALRGSPPTHKVLDNALKAHLEANLTRNGE